MRIALLAACTREIESLVREIGLPFPLKPCLGAGGIGRRGAAGSRPPFLTLGAFKGNEIAAVVTGVGKVRAAFTTQFVIDSFGPDRIILTGTAGALSPAVEPLDLVLPSRVLAFDVRPRPVWLETDVRAAAGLRRVVGETLPGTAVHEGALISGDRPLLKASERDRAASRFNALAVDMEAAAAVETAAANGVGLLALKAVTDRADESGTVDFKANLAAAARLLGKLFHHYLEEGAPLR